MNKALLWLAILGSAAFSYAYFRFMLHFRLLPRDRRILPIFAVAFPIAALTGLWCGISVDTIVIGNLLLLLGYFGARLHGKKSKKVKKR